MNLSVLTGELSMLPRSKDSGGTGRKPPTPRVRCERMNFAIIMGRSEVESPVTASIALLFLASICTRVDARCRVAGVLGYRTNAEMWNDSNSLEFAVKRFD